MTDIFISYSRQDEATARLFADALKAQGFALWWDDGLQPGQTYDEAIETALRRARAVIVLWSRTACASRWVRSEATIADRLGTLVPVMIEDCERPVQFELTQSANMIGWQGDRNEPRYAALVEHVRRLVAGNVAPTAAPTPVELVRAVRQPLPKKPSVAVLPFAVYSEAGDASYLADGLVEEIATSLSRFAGIFVIAGQSSLAYRGSTRSPREIAEELGVRYLLSGSVRATSGRVRIAVRLDEAASGRQIWAERYDDTMHDLFGLQDRIAAAVAGVIDLTLRDAEMIAATVRRTSSPSAYDLYLQATARAREFTRQSINEAVRLAEQAVAIDPTYAWAQIMLAYCHGVIFMTKWGEDLPAHREAAWHHSTTALQLDDNDEFVLALAAGVQLNTYGDFSMASRLAERALEISPESFFGNFWAGSADFENGNVERALPRWEKALRLNPVGRTRPMITLAIGAALFFLGRYEEALAILSDGTRLVPEHARSRGVLIATLVRLGRMEEAAAQAAALAPEHRPIDTLRYFYHRPHRQELKQAFALLPAP